MLNLESNEKLIQISKLHQLFPPICPINGPLMKY